jgi:hypothetical protein
MEQESFSRLNERFIEALRDKGAVIDTSDPECSLIFMISNSQAHKELVDIVTDDDRPLVTVGFLDPVPQVEQFGSILLEACQIVSSYSFLQEEEIVPKIKPIPIDMMDMMSIKMSNMKIALTLMIDRIQNPGVECPNINGLGKGSYIGHLQFAFENCIVFIAMYRF